MKRVMGPWQCDFCEEIIKTPADGVVCCVTEVSEIGEVGVKLGVIHDPAKEFRGCTPATERELGRWENLAGAEVELLNIPKMQEKEGFLSLLSLTEKGVFRPADVLELIKRLFVDGHEAERIERSNSADDEADDESTQFRHLAQVR